MAKTNPAAYIRQKVQDMQAVVNENTEFAFQYVGRAVEIDIEMLQKRHKGWPKCIFTHLGGELADANNEIWTRRMGVTIMFKSGWDQDELAERIDLYSEFIINTLQGSRTGDGIRCIHESEDLGTLEDGRAIIGMRTMIFEYKIDRETP
jgi:hypothetical protein